MATILWVLSLLLIYKSAIDTVLKVVIEIFNVFAAVFRGTGKPQAKVLKDMESTMGLD